VSCVRLTLVELRGWVVAVAPDCGPDGDWTYALEIDADWLDAATPGWRLDQILRVGNILDHVYGRKIIDERPNRMVNVPTVHVEHIPWLADKPTALPDDWYGRDHCSSKRDAVYAFPVRQPVPGPPLQEGSYVRMRGSLITDVPHDTNPWNTGGDAHTGGGPARWTELHPPDIIEVLPDMPRRSMTYGLLVYASNGAFSGESRSLDVRLDHPPEWAPVRIDELVLPGTNPGTITDGNATRTGARLTREASAVHVQVTVQGEAGWGRPGKFAALYRIGPTA
jgi:hypothetical protein